MENRQKEFRELVSAEKAHEIINNLKILYSNEKVFLKNAATRILAEDIFSSINVPNFDRSIKDGFAVIAQDTYNATETEPIKLEMNGSISAGQIPNIKLNSGTAAEIATGAPIPEGANSVVMVEHTSFENKNITVNKPVHISENIMRTGADIMKGERILRKNVRIGSREIGVLASVGINTVNVKKMNIGIISTGDELIDPSTKLTQGKIYDANTYALAAAILECGANPIIYGIVPDNEQLMSEIIDKSIQECHLVLTSGSTSAGVGDVMYKIIAEKGKILLHGISIKPGKPVVVGVIDQVPLIGLPGNPTSALAIFNEFITPLIYDTLEIKPPFKTKINAVLGCAIKSEGRKELYPVGVVRGIAYPADKTSGAITTLSDADGIFEIAQETEYLTAGTPIEVTLFGNINPIDILFVGGQCPGIDLLEDLTKMRFRVIPAGSTGGISAISGSMADISGINLPENDGYNIETIKNANIKNALLVKGYLREQGLIIHPESNIKNLKDIIGKKFANRNKGSGTRLLFDKLLEELSKEQDIEKSDIIKSIPGYSSAFKTHRAVCEAIISGKAAVGFGLGAIAQEMGLKFIPLATEQFDFLINKEIISIPEIQILLTILKSDNFSLNLPCNIYTYGDTGKIIELSN